MCVNMSLNFSFPEVQCDHPESTKDGFIEVSNFKGSYVYGSRATYHCNPGFILWGELSSQTKLTSSSSKAKDVHAGKGHKSLNKLAFVISRSIDGTILCMQVMQERQGGEVFFEKQAFPLFSAFAMSPTNNI